VAEVRLPDDVEATLAWTVREGVTNVVRHAQASACDLRLAVDDDAASLTVTDNGAARHRSGEATVRGNGLAGLAERAAAAGGSLEAGPGPDGGYRLRVSVPLGAA
jgi:two-component system sensor histidine kinase DesK